MNSSNITSESHSKLNKFQGLQEAEITIIIIENGKKVEQRGFFSGFSGRGIQLSPSRSDSQNGANLDPYFPFIGYDSAIIEIRSNDLVIYNNATAELIDFYLTSSPTFFKGSDGEGIVEENNKKVNAILTKTFGDLYPKLDMVS